MVNIQPAPTINPKDSHIKPQPTPDAGSEVYFEEGPRMISSFVGADPSAVTFDMVVELVCEPADGGVALPRYRAI